MTNSKMEVLSFKNDHYNIADIFEPGSVIHNRSWNYGLVNHASIVTVGVKFQAKCTFTVKADGAQRILRVLDDTGVCHAELLVNINNNAPCVEAVPRRELIKYKKKQIRATQNLNLHVVDVQVSQSSESEASTSSFEKDFKQSKSQFESSTENTKIEHRNFGKTTALVVTKTTDNIVSTTETTAVFLDHTEPKSQSDNL